MKRHRPKAPKVVENLPEWRTVPPQPGNGPMLSAGRLAVVLAPVALVALACAFNSDAKQYVFAVLSHWYALLATGVFTILALSPMRPQLSSLIARAIAVTMVLFATFGVWQEERTRFAKLEQLTSDSQPFSIDQEERMSKVLEQRKGSVVIATNSSDPDGKRFAERIRSTFSRAGWSVGASSPHPSGSGRSLRILASDPGSAASNAVENAFATAGLRYRTFRVCQGIELTIEVGEGESAWQRPN